MLEGKEDWLWVFFISIASSDLLGHCHKCNKTLLSNVIGVKKREVLEIVNSKDSYIFWANATIFLLPPNASIIDRLPSPGIDWPASHFFLSFPTLTFWFIAPSRCVHTKDSTPKYTSFIFSWFDNVTVSLHSMNALITTSSFINEHLLLCKQGVRLGSSQPACPGCVHLSLKPDSQSNLMIDAHSTRYRNQQLT